MKNKMRWINSLGVMAVSCLISGTVFGEAFIVREGKPCADIVIAEKPARAVKIAAAELQDIIFRISGARIEITNAPGKDIAHVYVGKSPSTDGLKITGENLASDGFRMVSGENYLALLGHDFDFAPREPWAHDNTPAEKERVYKEWDKLTGAKWGGPNMSATRDYNAKLDIWAQDGKGSLNAVYEFLRGLGCRWYYPGELGEILPQTKEIAIPKVDITVIPDSSLRYLLFYYHEYFMASADELKWQLRLGLNIDHERKSAHGLMMVHCRDEVKKEHPEYYALWNGKRANEHDGYGAPCLSSEGLFQETVRYVRAEYDIYGKQVVSVGPCDSFGSLCQCDLCKGKDTPGRGWDAQLSDYVWGFVDRVAKEVYKTHPDRRVSCAAYSTYLQPPEKIKTFSPNVAVIFCQARMTFYDPKQRKRFEDLVDAWLDKLPSKDISVFEYYLAGWINRSPYDGVPVYFTRSIAENLRFLKGKSKGEAIEVYRTHQAAKTPDILPVSHLNIYVTSRYYWDASQDLNVLLDEYYEKFYGPAAKEMKAFIEYSEANWPVMVKKPEPIDKATELLGAARRAAGENTVYARRIDGIVKYLEPLKALREKVAIGRTNAPQAFAVEKEGEIKLDGKLDKPFWKDVPVYELKELVSGGAPANKTAFQVVWSGKSLIFGIKCEDSDMKGLNMSAAKNEDANIFNDDAIELELETAAHSYYQIAINPAGFLVDVDRENRIDTRWSSGAEAAAFRGDNFWSLEVRVPTAGDNAATIDPASGVAGEKPTKEKPWFFNVCRQRTREKDKEHSAFSPTGSHSFHEVMKFGELIVK